MPFHKIVGRFDAQDNALYISTTIFKEYCTRRQADMDSILGSPSEDFTFVGRSKQRLAAGIKVCGGMPAVATLKFTVSKNILESLAEAKEDEITV